MIAIFLPQLSAANFYIGHFPAAVLEREILYSEGLEFVGRAMASAAAGDMLDRVQRHSLANLPPLCGRYRITLISRFNRIFRIRRCWYRSYRSHSQSDCDRDQKIFHILSPIVFADVFGRGSSIIEKLVKELRGCNCIDNEHAVWLGSIMVLLRGSGMEGANFPEEGQSEFIAMLSPHVLQPS